MYMMQNNVNLLKFKIGPLIKSYAGKGKFVQVFETADFSKDCFWKTH